MKERKIKNFFRLKISLSITAIFLFFAAFFSSCASTSPSNILEQIAEEIPKTEPDYFLSMNFAGDIMAHSVNYNPGNFDRIWRDISPILLSADLNFANIEAPVCDSLGWSSYPAFNMKSSYVEAAINAGFNVFSLANNHTNDQYLQGINATRKYFSEFNDKNSKNSDFDNLNNHEKKIWWAGLREKSFGDMTYSVIEKNGFKILFVAVTELLNRPDFASYIDYYPSTEKKRSEFKQNLNNLRKQDSYDLIVISIHTDEPEYVRSVTENHKKFYGELINECKADIIWANHPHITKIWETVDLEAEKTNGLNKSFIMYANGNTVSGQRTSPSFSKSPTERDDTGDGVIISVKMQKNGEKIKFTQIEPHFITTYITPSRQFVVKLVDDDLIHSLDRAEVTNWAAYLPERKKNLEEIKSQSKVELE